MLASMLVRAIGLYDVSSCSFPLFLYMYDISVSYQFAGISPFSDIHQNLNSQNLNSQNLKLKFTKLNMLKQNLILATQLKFYDSNPDWWVHRRPLKYTQTLA
jgi:hypothetical protein